MSGGREVVVYTSPSCPFCLRAKALLSQRGISFREIMLEWDDDSGWDELARRSGMKTVPVIYAGEKLVGGFQQLSELDQKDSLASLK